ncbi:MAG: DUF3786 domain-containing protein [Lachnospiraceae bacterium]|nr:DUF3786 domain-containing protein [Lachnospiraceae bacterium]
MADNYDKQVTISRGLFLNYDQQKMIEKFGLRADEQYIYIEMLNQLYRISRESGAVETEAGECRNFNVAMTIYDVLCCSMKNPVLAHQWVTPANLQMLSTSPDTEAFTRKTAEAFSGKSELLWAACEKIGGRRPEISAGADVCWEFDLFPFLPVQFRFWDKDEEFPAQIKLLWDKNTLDFLHFETTYYAMGWLLSVLKQQINLLVL